MCVGGVSVVARVVPRDAAVIGVCGNLPGAPSSGATVRKMLGGPYRRMIASILPMHDARLTARTTVWIRVAAFSRAA